MAVRYVNGSGYPIVYVHWDIYTFTYNLPYCNKLSEIWTERRILHELISPDINNPQINRAKLKLGWHVKFILDYSTLANATAVNNFVNILNASSTATIPYIIELQPRHDCVWRVFRVLETSESTTLDIAKGGTAAAGNKGIILQFETEFLQPQFLIANPEAELFTTHLNNHGIFSITTT